jgi:hypothetical protein
MTLHLHHPFNEIAFDEIEPAESAGRIAGLCTALIEAILAEPSPRKRAVLCCAAMETIGDAVRDSLGSWGETLQ